MIREAIRCGILAIALSWGLSGCFGHRSGAKDPATAAWPPSEAASAVASYETTPLPSGARLAADAQGDLQVAWMETAEHASRLLTRRRNAASWQAALPGFDVAAPAMLTDAAIDPEGHLHVLYLRRDGNRQTALHRMQTSEGWSAPQELMEGRVPAYAPRLAVDSRGRLHLAWYVAEQHNAAVLYRQWHDGQWGDLERVAMPSREATYWAPNLALGPGGAVHLVYFAITAHGAAVHYRRRGPGGWAPSVLLSKGQKFATAPGIAVDHQGAPHVVWVGGKQNREITYDAVDAKRWRPPEVVAVRDAPPGDPALAVDRRGTVYVAWSEPVNGGGAQVFLSRGGNGRWAVPVNVSRSEAEAYGVTATIADDTLYLSWGERTAARGAQIRCLPIRLSARQGAGT